MAARVHVVDNVRDTFGEFEGVYASVSLTSARHERRRRLQHPFPHTLRCRRHHAELSGCVGATGDRPSLLRDRGTIWFEGDDVWLANAAGERKIDPPDDLLTGPPESPPTDYMVTAYDWMHAHGTDINRTAPVRGVSRPDRGAMHADGPHAGHVHRRGNRHGSNGCDPPSSPRNRFTCPTRSASAKLASERPRLLGGPPELGDPPATKAQREERETGVSPLRRWRVLP